MKYSFILLTVLFIASTAFGQEPGMTPPPMTPTGMTMSRQMKPPVDYSDSVKFNATFKELFPLIRPMPTVQERAQFAFTRMLRMFKQRGVDSARAYDTIMKLIDKSRDEKILFNAYRENFTAEELKSIVAFFKTPAGKHYLEIEDKVMSARTKMIDQYVQQTVTAAVAPMEKPIERKPRPGMPGGPPMPGAPGAPPVPPPPIHN